MLSASALWWCAVLYAGALGLSIPWVVAPSTAHALLMSLGFMPLFFAGFLFTAGPKWLGMPEVPARSLLPFVLAYLVGWGMCLVGFHLSTLLAGAAMAIVATAWTG